MKKFSVILLISSLVLFSACSPESQTTESKTNLPNQTGQKETKNSTTVNEESNLEDFYGKPSVIVFAGTYCPHCRSAMPAFKAEIVDVFQDKINAWVNVIDGKGGKKFQISDIPQGFNPNLVFNDITKTQCQYVPSWLILDKEGKVSLSTCGSGKTTADMAEELKSLLK